MSDSFLLLPRIINGGIAGIVASTAVYPLDLVKTRLQTQKVGPNGERLYNSMMNAFMKVFKSEGFFALYRGLAVNLAFVTPELAVKLSSNDIFRKLLRSETEKFDIYRQAIAGGCTGAVTMLVTSPMEFLKIQMQDEGRLAAESNETMKKSQLTARSVVDRIMKKKGLAGLYKGLLPCAMRDIPFGVIYFPAFAFLYDLGPKRDDGEPTYYWSLISGNLAGAISAFLMTPFDVVKTRLQTLHEVGGEHYNGIIDCFSKIYKKEGLTAFFRGGACRIIVIAPLFGITQMIYYVGIAEYIFDMDTQKIVR